MEDSTSNLWIDSNSNHSDHFPVHLSVVRPMPRKKPKAGSILIPNYNKANFEDMCNFLLDHDFSEFYESDNIDDLWFYIKNTITDAVDKFVPTVCISNNNFPKWFTPDIKHHINKLRYFRRKDRSKSTTQSKSKIRLEELLQSEISEARSRWEEKLVNNFASSDSNKIFSYLRSLGRSTTLPNPMYLDSREGSTPQVKAKLFNEYFHSVLNTTSSSTTSSAIPSQLSDTLSHINFNSSDTFRALTSLDTTKSMGIDKISPKVLKHCAIALHEPINQLFQLSLDKGYLPPEWKQHLIIPILADIFTPHHIQAA